MVLEATMICIDNSEWMRNGDYSPSRLEAQQDAVNLICGAKTQSNPENTVGVLTMAGMSPMVQVALTQDLGKLLSSIASVKIEGKSNLSAALQVAQLALKHRLNKHQRQRIVAFVGSPVETDAGELVKLAKKLKKNNVAVDIVNFGEEEANTEKLKAFIDAINSNDNSHLVTVPPGPHILSDVLLQSPIVMEEGGAGGAGAAGAAGAFAEYGGIDPSVDPELAMVMRMSLEEERQRQKRLEEEQKKAAGGAAASTSESKTDVEMTAAPAASSEDEEMARAIAMSMSEAGHPAGATQPQQMETEMSEEEQMALALKLSMEEEQQRQQPQSQASSENVDQLLQDESFLRSVVGQLQGVNPNAVVKKDEEKEDQDKK
eukprot:GEZU01018631.1.p1 GENE.GEZU01018631.1~~GEZU01018631.1.p1  ORF type:complete len:404 (-),score=112.90 GEZU01018631.1:168-1289(-)